MKKKRYQVGNSFYEIPENEVSSFLKDNPKAFEVKFYDVKGSQYNIPIEESDAFEIDMGLKKKEPSQVALPTGGKAGTSEAPSGFGDLKPAKIQPIKIEGVGEEVALGRPKREVAVSTAVKPIVGLELAKEKATERAAAPKLPKTEKEIGEVEAFFNSLERGLKQGQIADMMALGQMPSREDLKEIARLTREQQALPASDAYNKFNSAPDLITSVKEFIKNPIEISSQIIGESLSALVRHGATRAGAGAGMGAALGSVVPGFGTAAGAGLGYLAGSGVAGYNLEMASSILDSFREAGVDISDEKSLQKGFDNPETLKKAREFANKRAIPIALFDMFSAGMGGKLLGKPAKTMLQKVGRGAAEVGIQTGLAGAGEATAQKVSGQKFNPTAIFAEMVGEVGGGAPDIVVGTMIEKKKQGQPITNEAAKLDIKPEELQDMLDISEATGELTDAQADEIKNEYTKVQEVRSVVPEQYKKNAEVIEALQKKKELEQQKKGLDPVFAKKIDAQIAEQEARIDRATAEEAPKEKYRVEYFDPEKGEMTHSYFDTRLEGDTFWGTLTDAQKSKGVKAYFEETTEPSFGEEPQVPSTPRIPKERAAQLREQIKVEEVGEEAAPQVPAAPEISKMVQPIDFSKQLEEKYGVAVDLLGNLKDDNPISLSRIVVPEGKRRQGVGSQVMKDIIEYADNNNKKLTLTPSTDFGGESVKKLTDFYKQFGFVENKGENKDFTIKDSMYRIPELSLKEIPFELPAAPEKAPEVEVVKEEAPKEIPEGYEGYYAVGPTYNVREFKKNPKLLESDEAYYSIGYPNSFVGLFTDRSLISKENNIPPESIKVGDIVSVSGKKYAVADIAELKKGKESIKLLRINENGDFIRLRDLPKKEAAAELPTEEIEEEEITEEAPTEEELKVSKEINIKEDEIPRVKKASTKRSRKSKDIAKTIESEAADVESSGDAERAADVVTTIERAEKAILEDKPVDTKFEDKYGVPEIELAREYDSRQGKVDIFTIYESLSGKKIERGAETEFISSFLNALNSEGFKLKKPLELDFGVVVNTTSSPAKKLKKEGFDSLEKIVSKDDLRPELQSVFFNKGNLVASDAHTLVVIKQKESDSDIIKNAKEKLIKSYSKTVGEKEATRFANEKYAPLEKSGLEGKLINQKTGEITDGKFPDYQAIIPQDFPLTQSIPIQEIIDLTNGAIEGLKSASKTKMAIMFNVTGDTEATLGINPSFLLKTLQALQANGAKSIKMGFGGPTKAITIRADNGDMGLVMPLMINEDDLKINITDAKPLTVKKAKVGDAVRKLAEKAREGKINKPGTARASTGFDAVWDAALEVVATSLEAGASVADAIEAGLKYVKSTGWYKKVKNKEEFDQQFKDVLNQEYAVQVKAAGEVPVQPEAGVSEEVEAGVPPTEPPKATQEGEGKGEEKRLSGIKKGLVSKEVLESVDLDRTGDKKLLMAGRQIIESGEVEPKLLIDKIIDEGKGVLSPAEVVALITYKADLDTKVEDLSAEIEQLEAAGEDIGTKGVELKNLEVEQRNFEIAAVITAQQQSMSFRLRRWMLDRTYSLQQQIAQYKKANGGTIPSDVLQQFEKMDAEIQELKKQIKEAEIRKVDEEGQVAVDNIIDDVKREDARTLTDEEVDAKVQKGVQEEIDKIYEKLPAKRKSRADEAITALEKIQKRLRSRTYDASIGIPVAIIDMGITTIKNAIKAGVAIEKAIELGIDKIKEKLKGKPFDNEAKFRQDLLDGFKAEGVKTEKEVAETPSVNDDGTINIPEKFLRDLVRKGVNTIEGLTDAAFKELESQLPGLTKRQVRDAITQYGRTVNPTQDEIRQQLATAKRLGRLISELEDLKSMSKAEFALKYFKQPTPSKITEAEKNLKKQINSLARDLKTDAQVLAQAKESAKRRIEELQRRLKEKDYSSRPKKLVKADAELEILLGKKQALQDKFEEAKKKAELKNRTLGQRIEDILLEIFSGISRALVAGLDLSAAFVQGTRRIFTNPVMSAKAFAEGLRQFASPTRMERFMQRYKGTYNYSVARNSGLAISDVDGTLSAKEQIFVVQWANTIYDLIASVVTLGHKPSAEFIKRINPLKASQRAFDGYMNYIRISSFETEMAALKNMGYTPDSNPEVYKAAADFVNTATGRANMGPLEASSKWLSVIMFAPRKTVSEFKLYSPLAFLYYAYMPAPVRKRALIDFAKFSASVLVTHVLVKAAIDTYEGDEEDYEDFWNPDSPNFLAFKIGDKRISFLGGIKSMIVFMSRLFGQDFVDQYGITTKFGERYGKKIDTKLDLATQFLLGKASPGTGAIRDYLDKNPNYENDDEILQNLVVPMWIQDANELYKEDPAAVTAMFNMLAIIGANIRKVDMKQVQDQIIFKEKVKGKEVKRIVELTDAQKEEFQNLVKQRAKIELAKIAPIVKNEKSGSKRAEYDKMAIDQAKKDAQKLLEKRYIKIFRQFPVQGKEQDKLMEKVKKKLK